MIDSIHNLEYFSIARDVKKTKYRQYIRKYYTFKDENDRQLFETIQNTNILIIDDIVTSGTTISHLLKCLRSVNDTNNIVIFSLIGKNID
jgi:predicted amidophosphoribosyltransferase